MQKYEINSLIKSGVTDSLVVIKALNMNALNHILSQAEDLPRGFPPLLESKGTSLTRKESISSRFRL